jgi:hypothetical protein
VQRAIRLALGILVAGTDCEFDTSAGMRRVTGDVVSAKQAALIEGARIARRGGCSDVWLVDHHTKRSPAETVCALPLPFSVPT